MIVANPCLSIVPMSPEWNQPSRSTASAVACGSLRYPRKMCGPLRRTSPSLAIFTAPAGIGWPTDPMTTLPGRLATAGPVDSVSP